MNNKTHVEEETGPRNDFSFGLCCLGVPDTRWILRLNLPSPLKLSQVVPRLDSERDPWPEATWENKPHGTKPKIFCKFTQYKTLTITYFWFFIFCWERKLKDFRLSTIFRNCCLSFRSSASASCSLVFSEGSWGSSESFLLCFLDWVRQGGGWVAHKQRVR